MMEEMKRTSKFSPKSTALRVAGFITRLFFWLVGIACFALILGLVVMWLWNWLLPGIFGIDKITYLEGFGLVVLTRILFGKFSTRRHPFAFGGHHPHRWGHKGFDFCGDRGDKASDCCDDMGGKGERMANFCGGMGMMGGGPSGHPHERMRQYRDFWFNVGKPAFKDYMKKMEEEGKKKRAKTEPKDKV